MDGTTSEMETGMEEQKFIIAYKKDASLLLYGSVHSVTANDFLRLLNTLLTDTVLIAEGEKAIIDHEEYNEMCDNKRLRELQEFFRKHKDKDIGFIKFRIDGNDLLVMHLYESFKETRQFVEFSEE